VPEIIDPVFAKTSPKRSFSITEYERFGLVFMKTRVYKFGHRKIHTYGDVKQSTNQILPNIQENYLLPQVKLQSENMYTYDKHKLTGNIHKKPRKCPTQK
jgi:hypothetical protein